MNEQTITNKFHGIVAAIVSALTFAVQYLGISPEWVSEYLVTQAVGFGTAGIALYFAGGKLIGTIKRVAGGGTAAPTV